MVETLNLELRIRTLELSSQAGEGTDPSEHDLWSEANAAWMLRDLILGWERKYRD